MTVPKAVVIKVSGSDAFALVEALKCADAHKGVEGVSDSTLYYKDRGDFTRLKAYIETLIKAGG